MFNAIHLTNPRVSRLCIIVHFVGAIICLNVYFRVHKCLYCLCASKALLDMQQAGCTPPFLILASTLSWPSFQFGALMARFRRSYDALRVTVAMVIHVHDLTSFSGCVRLSHDSFKSFEGGVNYASVGIEQLEEWRRRQANVIRRRTISELQDQSKGGITA